MTNALNGDPLADMLRTKLNPPHPILPPAPVAPARHDAPAAALAPDPSQGASTAYRPQPDQLARALTRATGRR